MTDRAPAPAPPTLRQAQCPHQRTPPPQRQPPQCPAPPNPHSPRPPHARGGAAVGRRALQQLDENPLQTLFGTAIVALLIFNFTGTNRRIDDTNERITRLEQRIAARFTALEEDINEDISALEEEVSALREDVAEINLKLTALIAALNQTDEVAAAIEGRLIERNPGTGPAGTPDTPGPAPG